MITKPADLDESDLKLAIEAVYGIAVRSLVFMPVGEASWSYHLTITLPPGPSQPWI